jgi:hypothetical protein
MELDDTNDSLIIRYWADHPAAERFVEAVRGARAESPLALELEELDVDLRRLHAVAHELTRPDSAVAAALGIVPTVAVVDEASGSVVVEIVDDGSGRFDGDRSSSVVVDGVVVQIRPGGAEVEFQAGA